MLPRVKRFLERFTADPAYREAVVRDPCELARTVRPLWDANCREENQTVAAYRSLQRERLQAREAARRAATPSHRGYRAWRQRQILRCRSQLGLEKADALVHHPAAFELCRGCSVGCWFCGVSAPALGGVWDYAENRDTWRKTLEDFKRLIGPAAGQSVCYWATDPLDNPDYERFCLDFHEILGVFPPTTTALAHRFPERARRLLELARSQGQERNRFSVLSRGQLERLHQAFTEEELSDVELVLQNKGSLVARSQAGRARPPGGGDSTIACVSGFLINMVEGTVRLISPCPASDRWPDGYRVHASGTLEDVPSMLASMTERLPLERPVRLRRDLELRDGHLVSRYATHRLERPELVEHLREAATPAELARRLPPMEKTLFVLNRLFERGLLEEESDDA